MRNVINLRRARNWVVVFSAAAFPALLWSNRTGAIPRHTGGSFPSESVCTECHNGAGLNKGPGKVDFSVQPYTPGGTQTIQVTVSDPNQQRWGFQITARLAGNTLEQAGAFKPVDQNVWVACDDESVSAPCPTGMLQFPTHTLAGTRRGTRGGATFLVEWTAPGSNVGDIIFAAAGNAANGDDTPNGDNIYTRQITVSPAAPLPAPQISSSGVVGAGLSGVKQISPNAIVSVFGQNFAPAGTAKGVTGSDLVDGKLPANLAGVCVQVGSELGRMFFVSPGQVNVQAPSLAGGGNVPVQVIVNCGAASDSKSNVETVVLQPATPEFFFFKLNADGKNPIAAVNAITFARIGAADLIPGVTSPAKPGDFVSLFTTGLGATNPSFAAGALPDKIAATLDKVAVTVNGVGLSDSDVLYAGVAPGFAGLYQVNIKIPADAPDGDLPVAARMGSFSTPPGAFLTVKK